MDADRQLVFGDLAEWRHFESRHAPFFERFSNLRQALHTAFLRQGESAEPIDRFIFFYGRLCCEDYFDLLLCCGNGRGAAAFKLLRTLYERAVTLRYLHEHPDELDSFFDYHYVQSHKLLMAIEETLGKDRVSVGVAADVKARYNEVKDDFKISVCKECGTERTNHTWSKLHFAAMAKKTGSLGSIIVLAYYIPLKHSHATAGAMYSQLEQMEGGGMTFTASSQREFADDAFIAAHTIILQVLGIQSDRFKISGLLEQINICAKDFLEVHRRDDGPAA
jgi:hypothetical protein